MPNQSNKELQPLYLDGKWTTYIQNLAEHQIYPSSAKMEREKTGKFSA